MRAGAAGVNNVGQTLRGQVSIGLAPGTAASAITMPLLQTVRNELPEVMVYLQESSGTALNDKLLAGQLDMAVLYERSPVAGIVSQPLLKEDLYLVGTRDCPGQSVDSHGGGGDEPVPAPRLQRSAGAGHRGIHPASSIGENYRRDRIHYHPDAAIASGMGATVLPESAARSLCGAANGWMARISTPSMSLSLSLNMSARGSLSPQAQAVKEILLSLVSRPSLENRELQLVS
ncbi:nitrogen assimilation transcriptional regulator [Klebsiella pneumoniae]|uniref:Nitrogen assimilation transcriptional regulator n=1 Tax=Klebsiella pneumoniae TaxID=573 RepID=A0A377W146_KLEPN|nr:nitrogen assimilation transcriptional regulator [Klebsiella pneumoniae]